MARNRDKESYIVRKRIGYILWFRDLILTLALWGLWLYLLYPLIGLILWKGFGVDIFFYYDSRADIADLEKQLRHFTHISGIAIGLIVASVLGWGYYNQKKFARYKNKRRTLPQAITSDLMAKALDIDSHIIDTTKEARYIQFYHTHKSPDSSEKPFKPLSKKPYKQVNIIFNDDWEEVRRKSNFAYTHKRQ